jgi:hypothetical protein
LGESAKHLELLSYILSHIEKTYVGMDSVVTIHDLPGTIGCEKPPTIGGFRPDVYAIDAPLTRTIIGEAKTQADLERDHSAAQCRAFISYLRLQPNSVFIIAVPWQAHALARTLMLDIQRELDASGVQVVVLDDISGAR